MKKYEPKKIESKWQKIWEKELGAEYYEVGNESDLEEDEDNKLIQRAGYPKSSMNPQSYIRIVNKFIKETLGPNYTSHSFRQGLLTEMAAKGINVQIMAKFVGHTSFKTTLNYVKPTDEMVMSSLVR